MPRKGTMLAKPINMNIVERWRPPYIYQPKINGFHGRIEAIDGKVTIWSTWQNEYNALPHINQEFELLIQQGDLPPNFERDGELYNHSLSLNTIQSIVKRKNSIHPNHELIQFHLFDIIENIQQQDRILRANTEYYNILAQMPHLKLVPSVFSESLSDFERLLNEYMHQGYEGIIIRKAEGLYERKKSSNIFKCKPRRRDIYQIIGYEEEISIYGESKGRLGSFLCHKNGQTFSVGTGRALRDEGRNYWWKHRNELTTGAWYALVTYPELTEKRQVPHQPVVLEVYYGIGNK